MIFVTIGTTPYSFNRLIKKMDLIAANLDEKVVMQIGVSEYEPKNAEFFRVTSRENIKKYYKDARVIISHAAAGSILMAFKYNKTPILVPRMKKYAEHVDDHQLEGAKELEKDGMSVIYAVDDLESVLNDYKNSYKKTNNHNTLIKNLNLYLKKLEES
jgi:beta-1,4-N-acetylglucosaminyltransferase